MNGGVIWLLEIEEMDISNGARGLHEILDRRAARDRWYEEALDANARADKLADWVVGLGFLLVAETAVLVVMAIGRMR